MNIELGTGSVRVEAVRQGDKQGVLLQPTGEDHTIGAFASTEPQEYKPDEGDVVIWFGNLDSLRILQDELARVALAMQGVPQIAVATA